jgi:hypothetical protein
LVRELAAIAIGELELVVNQARHDIVCRSLASLAYELAQHSSHFVRRLLALLGSYIAKTHRAAQQVITKCECSITAHPDAARNHVHRQASTQL